MELQWGHKSFSCIQAVQNRALRYYLGLGKYAPVAAMQGDMGWSVSEHRQWVCVTRQWCRSSTMEPDRVNSKIFHWAYNNAALCKKKNSIFHIKRFYDEIGMNHICDIVSNPTSFSDVKKDTDDALKGYFSNIWSTKINRDSAVRGEGRNKLRTYRTFKTVFETEPYVSALISRKDRQALAKFHSGTAPLRLETGRYIGEHEHERICRLCSLNEIESEEHVLIRCTLYHEVRSELYDAIATIINDFDILSDNEKLSLILSSKEIVNITAKTCRRILDIRSQTLYLHV